MQALKAKADERAAGLASTIDALKAEGITSANALGGALNARGYTTARGGRWTARSFSMSRLCCPERPNDVAADLEARDHLPATAITAGLLMGRLRLWPAERVRRPLPEVRWNPIPPHQRPAVFAGHVLFCLIGLRRQRRAGPRRRDLRFIRVGSISVS